MYYNFLRLICVIVCLPLGQSAVTPTSMATQYDTIVIGLGASGVAALRKLSDAGVKVLGLEAAPYIGGRVRTVNFSDGVVELGAEWIHGERPSKVYDWAKSHQVDLKRQPLEIQMFDSTKQKLNQEEMDDLILYCLQLAENPPDEPQPLGQYVTKKFKEHIKKEPQLMNDEDFKSNFLEFIGLLVNNIEASNNWNDVSTSSKYTELDGFQHWSWHGNGYKTLFDIMMKNYNNGPGIPAEILLNKEVEEITWPQNTTGNVTVKCKDGSSYSATAAILTVSVGVLKERHQQLFNPPLPEVNRRAIEQIVIGLMDKIIFSYDQPWWNKDVGFFGFLWKNKDRAEVPKEDYWITQIYGASIPMGSTSALTLWTSGEVAKLVENLPEDVVKRKCTDLLRKFLGDTVPEPQDMIRSAWHSNPYTRGSYTFDDVNRPDHPFARSELSSPLCDGENNPKVLFAGEATNEYHFSTVHGAVETGIREAERLLNKTAKSKI